jgi:hypothetical protein
MRSHKEDSARRDVWKNGNRIMVFGIVAPFVPLYPKLCPNATQVHVTPLPLMHIITKKLLTASDP